jgi:hypothetical protein
MNSPSELLVSSNVKSIGPEEIFYPSTITYDFIFILNNNPQYKSSRMQEFATNQIADGAKIIDTWDVMELAGQFTLTNLFVGRG